MRKIVVILSVLLIPLAVCGRSYYRPSRAKNVEPDNYHFGYISFSAGYSSLSQTVKNVHTTGDFSYLIGLGYEFRINSFWLSVGAQYMQEKSKTNVDEFKFRPQFKGLDDQEKAVTYYEYQIRQTDRQTWKTIDIPIMLGYYNSGFYVGAGAKVGFSIGSTISTKGEYDLSAQYDRYIDEFREVNYYTHYNVPEQQWNLKLRPQFSLIGEIGYDILSPVMTNKAICHVLKVGFYFEYGLRTPLPQDAMDPISIQGKSVVEAAKTKADVRQATINPFYLSASASDKWVVPYYVGVKLTYMFGGSRHNTGTWHKGCQCYQ